MPAGAEHRTSHPPYPSILVAARAVHDDLPPSLVPVQPDTPSCAPAADPPVVVPTQALLALRVIHIARVQRSAASRGEPHASLQTLRLPIVPKRAVLPSPTFAHFLDFGTSPEGHDIKGVGELVLFGTHQHALAYVLALRKHVCHRHLLLAVRFIHHLLPGLGHLGHIVLPQDPARDGPFGLATQAGELREQVHRLGFPGFRAARPAVRCAFAGPGLERTIRDGDGLRETERGTGKMLGARLRARIETIPPAFLPKRCGRNLLNRTTFAVPIRCEFIDCITGADSLSCLRLADAEVREDQRRAVGASVDICGRCVLREVGVHTPHEVRFAGHRPNACNGRTVWCVLDLQVQMRCVDLSSHAILLFHQNTLHARDHNPIFLAKRFLLLDHGDPFVVDLAGPLEASCEFRSALLMAGFHFTESLLHTGLLHVALLALGNKSGGHSLTTCTLCLLNKPLLLAHFTCLFELFQLCLKLLHCALQPIFILV
mmetsp:Transcript_120265/g.300005  ORF Transcript_120265/g.300005 Transcript_120265/m.300005 type:complete len:486 (-) Transcript_120265:765-2222(-)